MQYALRLSVFFLALGSSVLSLGCSSSSDGPRACVADQRALGKWEELPLPPRGPEVGQGVCRRPNQVVWTGKELIVWAGCRTGYTLGGRFNLEASAWSTFAPPPGYEDNLWHDTYSPIWASAVWTGEAVLFWGGHQAGVTSATPTSLPPEEETLDDGFLYYPEEDRWEFLNATQRPAGRWRHAALWTGEGLYVYGGVGGALGEPVYGGAYLDFSTREWHPLPTEGMPEASSFPPSLVWTGSKLLAWGGAIYDKAAQAMLYYGTGAAYDPKTGRWSPLSTRGAPTARHEHLAVWTGREMVIWGGVNEDGWLSDGGAYDPATDSWRTLSQEGAPVTGDVGFWLGKELLVPDAAAPCSGGALYNIATDAWLPLAALPDSTPYNNSRSVWTGDALLRYGGEGEYGEEGRFWRWTR